MENSFQDLFSTSVEEDLIRTDTLINNWLNRIVLVRIVVLQRFVVSVINTQILVLTKLSMADEVKVSYVTRFSYYGINNTKMYSASSASYKYFHKMYLLPPFRQYSAT